MAPRRREEESVRARSVALAVVSVAVGVASALGAGTALAAPRAGSDKPPRVIDCVGPAVREPSSFTITCADDNSRLVGLDWQSWTATHATADGVYSLNDCTPYCAAGKFHSYPAAVTLWDPKHTKHGTLFSRLTVAYKKGQRIYSFEIQLPLSPL
ncbi:MAG: hypothetical protein ABSB55_00765 [Acidimicrobiales bacterium]|jgi:hypothetical protein